MNDAAKLRARPHRQLDLVHQSLLGEAVDKAALAVTVYDNEGRMVAVSERASALLGLSRDELLDHDVADFTDGGIDRTVLLSQRMREGVRLVNRADGTTVPCAFVVSPTTVGNFQYFVAVWWELAAGDLRARDAG